MKKVLFFVTVLFALCACGGSGGGGSSYSIDNDFATFDMSDCSIVDPYALNDPYIDNLLNSSDFAEARQCDTSKRSYVDTYPSRLLSNGYTGAPPTTGILHAYAKVVGSQTYMWMAFEEFGYLYTGWIIVPSALLI